MIGFALTQEEADAAAARAAWRAALAGGLLARHLAPLAAFALALMFAAILGWTGLISRRAAEIALIAAAAAYMAYRLWTRRRLFAARRAAQAWAGALHAAGDLKLTLEADGLRLRGAGFERACPLDRACEIEEAAGLVYLWPRDREPLVWPARADAEGALVTRARRRLRGEAAPAAGD